MSDTPPEDLGQRYRDHLRALHRALEGLVGAEATPIAPPASEADIVACEASLGRLLPEPLRAFYAVVDGFAAFRHLLVPARRLASIGEFYSEDVEEYLPGGEAAEFLETDARLTGEVIALSQENVVYLLYLVTGPDTGSIWVFNRARARFAPAAPSLEQLLDCWAAIAQGGLIEAAIVYGQVNEDIKARMVAVPEADEAEAAAAAAVFGCTGHAINVFEP